MTESPVNKQQKQVNKKHSLVNGEKPAAEKFRQSLTFVPLVCLASFRPLMATHFH